MGSIAQSSAAADARRLRSTGGIKPGVGIGRDIDAFVAGKIDAGCRRAGSSAGGICAVAGAATTACRGRHGSSQAGIVILRKIQRTRRVAAGEAAFFKIGSALTALGADLEG